MPNAVDEEIVAELDRLSDYLGRSPLNLPFGILDDRAARVLAARLERPTLHRPDAGIQRPPDPPKEAAE